MSGAELHPLLVWAARLLGAGLVAVLIVIAYRQIRRLSRQAAAVVAAGIIIRAAASAALFFVSYLDLPFLRGLHTGDGFWALAPDARLYFAIATGEGGFGAEMGRGGASPAYVQILSHWMQLVGFSPASGAFLNLACYVAVAWLVVRLLEEHERLCLALLAAFTFSPALLVFGTQSLKDVLFDLLLFAICAGAWALLRERSGGVRQLAADIVVALGVAGGLHVVAGIRAYVALFVCLALTLALTARALWPWRRGTWRRLGRAALVLLVVNALWLTGRPGQIVVARASGPAELAGDPGDADGAGGGIVGRLTASFDRMRAGFVASGGNTNVGNQAPAADWSGRMRALGYGLLLIFVPFSALAWAGAVPVVGKQAFIAIADVDTVFMDVSFAVIAVLVARSARRRGLNHSYALFAGLLALSLTLSLAYVVTNYGTLFRLRLMAAVPFWMMSLAVRHPTGDLDA